MQTQASSTRTVPLAKAIIIYCVVSLFLFFEMAVQVSPSVMAFHLMHDLGMSAFALGVMSGCYFYTYTAMQIPSGLLFDRFHPRVVICISILICTAGCLLLSIADSALLACLARLLMGFGSAFAFVSVLVVTKDLFSHKAFATMTGITQMLAALGAMSGQLPVSAIVGDMGWRHTMVLFAIIGFVIAIGVYCLLCYDRASPCGMENCAKEPLSQRLALLFTNKQTWFVALYACLLWAPMSGFTSLWGVPFLIKVDHYSNESAALLTSMMWIGLAVVSPLLGYISTRFGTRKHCLTLSALIGAIAFALVLYVPLSAVWIGVLLFIAGGACAGQALSFTVVKENNNPQISATAIAVNNMAVVISGAIFQPLIGWFLNGHAVHVAAEYREALTIILIAYLVGFAVSQLFIKETLTQA